MVAVIINTNCRSVDLSKIALEKMFAPLYSVMFVVSVILNSLLLYVVIKKELFLKEKRTFHKLFQAMIGLDLVTSLLILPQILIKLYLLDRDVFVALDLFIGVRDFTISSQMVVLVLMATERLLGIVVPFGTWWSLTNVQGMVIVSLAVLGTLYLVRFILFCVPLRCETEVIVDRVAKSSIGILGGVLMVSVFLMYSVLFVLICRRQVKRQKSIGSPLTPLKKEASHRPPADPSSDSVPKDQCMPSPLPRMKSKIEATRNSLSRKIGSTKFAKVLFGINILMIISFLPAILYNGKFIEFPKYSGYYLFYFHSLGDPVLFFLSQKELKVGLISIFKSNHP